MEDKMLYKDPSQPVDVRVEDLLSRMTLEEKGSTVVRRSCSILYCRW